MVYLFLDGDEYLTGQRVAALKAKLGDPEMAGLNTTDLTGSQTNAAELLGHAAMMPFLTERRLVVVTGYLSHLDKRMAASKGKEAAAYQEAAKLTAGLTAVPESCDLIFVDNGVDKGRGLWKGFQPADKEEKRVPGLQELIRAGQVVEEPAKTPDAKTLPAWLQQQAQARRIAIEPRAVQLLANYVGPNLRQLDNELEKLATYAAGRAITPADVELLVSDASEALIWDLTDALSQRNGKRAMQSLRSLLRAEVSPIYLVQMIARQYRIILKVKEAMQGTRGDEHAIAARVDERPYPVKKAMQQATAYTFSDLESIMDRLLQADFAMKMGADQETESHLLIAELTQRR